MLQVSMAVPTGFTTGGMGQVLSEYERNGKKHTNRNARWCERSSFPAQFMQFIKTVVRENAREVRDK